MTTQTILNVAITSEAWEDTQDYLPTFLEGFDEWKAEEIASIAGVDVETFYDEADEFDTFAFIEKVEKQSKVINRQVEVTAFYNETISRYDLKARIEFMAEFENGMIETYTDQDELYQNAEAIEIWEKENGMIWHADNVRKVIEGE